MMPRHVALFLAAGLLLVGCSKRPSLCYGSREDVSVQRFRDIALDPRTDLLFVNEGKRSADATAFKPLVLSELQSIGYRVVPADQAQLWLDVYALREDAGHPMGPSGEGGPGPGHGRGPGMGAGHRGGPGGHMGGAITLVVALIQPADAEVRWRGALELSQNEKPRRGPGPGPGAPSPLDTVRRLLEPLRGGGAPGVPAPASSTAQ